VKNDLFAFFGINGNVAVPSCSQRVRRNDNSHIISQWSAQLGRLGRLGKNLNEIHKPLGKILQHIYCFFNVELGIREEELS